MSIEGPLVSSSCFEFWKRHWYFEHWWLKGEDGLSSWKAKFLDYYESIISELKALP